MSGIKIVTIVGARPQFIKAAVVSRAIRAWNESLAGADRGRVIDERIMHTGQHFDAGMSKVFFDELAIPHPHVHLGISGGGHGEMTGRMLQAIEPVLQAEEPDWVLVYGDTNSTLAGTLAAAKLHLPVAHAEAGLRSFNRRMPEEVNRILTDHAADVLLTPTDAATRHLRNEGIPADRIAQVGDVMFDAMIFCRDLASSRSHVLSCLKLLEQKYILATVHRAENTEDAERLADIIDGLCRLADRMPVILPLHPRTQQALDRQQLRKRAESRLRLIDPVGYLDMVQLEAHAALIATDSGGVQKEAYFNRVPCITLRNETEWTELIEAGANLLTGADPEQIVSSADLMIGREIGESRLYGNGDAGERIIKRLISASRPIERPTTQAAPVTAASK